MDRGLCLGIVPWAPVPGGLDVLSAYMDKVKERTRTAKVWRKIRGVRYLVQDKPAGVMLEAGFVESLRWLGREGLTFDLGVDARQCGLGQLREAVEMMERVYRGVESSEVTIVISELFAGYLSFWLTSHSQIICASQISDFNLTPCPRIRSFLSGKR